MEEAWLDDAAHSDRGSITSEEVVWFEAEDHEDEIYSVYFKGFLSQEWSAEEEEAEEITVLRIGVVICDSMDNSVFRLGKATKCSGDTNSGGMSPIEANLEALIQGLMAAAEMNIRNLVLFYKYRQFRKLCNSLSILSHNDIASHSTDSEEELLILKLGPKIEMIKDMRKQFSKSKFCLAMESTTKNGYKHASKLAKEAKSSCPCGICLDKTEIRRMISIHDCPHKCCLSCVKKHVEVKLTEGILPNCPHEGCKSSIKIRACKQALSPKLVALLEERLKESQIPVVERVYCPYPKCSNLMSEGEVLRYSKHSTKNAEESGYRKCLKCDCSFCVNCKVPWHREMTCSDYKRLHPYSCAEEEMLISLAKSCSWRSCIKCSHMIELNAGCYHIVCRCGCQFCYNCGLEWKKDKACKCPLWNERLIIY